MFCVESVLSLTNLSGFFLHAITLKTNNEMNIFLIFKIFDEQKTTKTDAIKIPMIDKFFCFVPTFSKGF
ncbi:hypothetical protein GCM10023210_06080 [Chryseobacterium ginsengisoli]|uniref:Uncharacterized protein n=1 Tax=Chryseobacterium ginsengisoli TaxID=363853 RepID=A0ABP9LZH8_9FLAO